MFNNFEETKKQISELADVLNKIKSEAVQIRLLELLFQDGQIEDEEEEQNEIPNKTRPKSTSKKKSKSKSKTKAKAKTGSKTTSKKKAGSGTGAYATLTRLYQENFFSKPRTIGDICAHSDTNLARRIKPNEISGKLARMVRDSHLKRSKNSDNQYEYSNP